MCEIPPPPLKVVRGFPSMSGRWPVAAVRDGGRGLLQWVWPPHHPHLPRRPRATVLLVGHGSIEMEKSAVVGFFWRIEDCLGTSGDRRHCSINKNPQLSGFFQD